MRNGVPIANNWGTLECLLSILGGQVNDEPKKSICLIFSLLVFSIAGVLHTHPPTRPPTTCEGCGCCVCPYHFHSIDYPIADFKLTLINGNTNSSRLRILKMHEAHQCFVQSSVTDTINHHVPMLQRSWIRSMEDPSTSCQGYIAAEGKQIP